MKNQVQILVSNLSVDPVVVHATSSLSYGIEDGLILLNRPNRLLDSICAVWPELKLIVFAINSSNKQIGEMPEVLEDWAFYSEEIKRWGFAILLNKNSKEYGTIEYIKKKYYTDKRKIEILIRNHRKPEIELIERFNRAEELCDKINKTLKSVLNREVDSENDIRQWKSKSPIVMVPFFTSHGEGVRLFLTEKDRNAKLNEIQFKIEQIASKEGATIKIIDGNSPI